MKIRLLPAILAMLSVSCADPVQRIRNQAAEAGFLPLELSGGGFLLTAYSTPTAQTATSVPLHIYLEGDGTPWSTRHDISADPTPHQAVMLRLMEIDPTPSLYLGRPCYFGHAKDNECSPALWTSHRYGSGVVDSMAAALAGFLRRHPHDSLTFLGHSGGGALAILMAARFPQTRAVVTLAGNLDIAAWTEYHRYTELSGSLNPSRVLLPGVREYHYFGGEDATVPPEPFAALAHRRTGAKVEILRGFDHNCCWQEVWRNILATSDAQ